MSLNIASRLSFCLAIGPTLFGSAIAVVSAGTAMAPLPAIAGEPVEETDRGTEHRPSLTYHVTASGPRLNRRTMGNVRRTVQGIPAEPVDSMVWDGVGSTPVEGRLELRIDPTSNTGFIRAEWTDENGTWVFRQTRFVHPDEHPSGVRIGSSVHSLDTLINESTAQNVYLHGDTTAGMPVLPTVFTHLATWGPAEIYLDGALFVNPFEIPAPLWEGHMMVTEGVRRSDGTVRTIYGEIYDPSRATEGAVEEGDLEVHLVFHDDALPMTSNVPAMFSFFYHLVFEEVRIEIVHRDDLGAAR